MLNHTRKTYISSNYALDLEELGDIHVNDYSGTFKFALYIQLSDPDFDILDNKYVEVVPYEVTSGWSLNVNKDLKLRKCNQEEINELFGEFAFYNKESLCFDENSNMRLRANWMGYKNYVLQQFTLIECQPSKKKKCASPEQI